MAAIHVCKDFPKGIALPDGALCKKCNTIIRGGKPGPAHVCGKDSSTCLICDHNGGAPVADAQAQ